MKPLLTDALCTHCALCCDGTLFADVELVGDDGLLIARLEGFEATVDVGLKAAFALSRLTPAAAF